MEKLSQEEVDALINALGDSNAQGKSSLQVENDDFNALPFESSRKVRTYDFRSPDKFSKEQIRTMLLLHENFSRNAATALSAYLRSMIQIETVQIKQETYTQWLQEVADPTILAITNLPPLPERAMLELSTDIAFPILDRLMGGKGSLPPRRRALTEIESKVVQRVIQILLNAWAEAWRPVTQVKVQIESLESSPLFAQLIPPSEMVISVLFHVTVGNAQGDFRLCIPYMVLEPILPKLSAHNWFAPADQGVDDGVTQQWVHLLQAVDVDLHVELPHAEISVREMVELSIGDVVALPGRRKGPLSLYVNGIPKFLVTLGTSGHQMAARICSIKED